MANVSNYNKHIKLSERIKIESGLNANQSLRSISKNICKSVSTISREIKTRSYKEKGNYFNGFPGTCEKLNHSPYVCNACPLAKKCRKPKLYYSSERAQEEYKKTLVDSRIGIDQTTQEFKDLNKIIKDEVNKGHSFALILHNHPELNVSERTLYHYQEHGYLSSKNIDLPRKVRYKKRKKKNENQQSIAKKEDHCRNGRSYEDFNIFIRENNISFFVEMDTVEGIIESDEPCLLTLYLKQCELLLAFKINSQTITEVNRKIKEIKASIGYELFHKIFGIILTDNGSEFKCPSEIEDNGPDVINSKLFYCDAQRSDQKSQIELSHEYIRRYIPKGISMANYTNQNILDMISHINSTPRKSLNWKSPYQVYNEMFQNDLLNQLGIYQVNSKDVILNDDLFHTINH